MKTRADQLLHPVLTVILKIKVVLTTIAVIATVVNIFMNLDAVTMDDWLQIFLTVVAIYGAWLMLQTKKLGFYLVVIPHLIMGIISLFFLPYMLKGLWMSFGQIAFIMLLMLLKRHGKNAYQVLWGYANRSAVSDEESLTSKLEEKQEDTPRNPQESDLWERIEAAYKSFDSSYTAHNSIIVPASNQYADESQWVFDEATCVQFVYLYTEIALLYRNNCSAFFNLYGKKRANHDSVIIGSLNIGDSMSNMSICQYDYNKHNPLRLCPVPLFWDSFDLAGDNLRKVVIIFEMYDCDVVLLSGHLTLLSPIRDAFLKYNPVSPDRLLIMDKFRIGHGFPFVDQYGYLNNSRSIVLMGATIGYLSSESNLNGFSLDFSALGKKMNLTTDCFVLLNDKMEPSDSCFITPTQNHGEIIADSFPKYIGTKQFETASYPTRPFYILDINEKEIIKHIKHSRQISGSDDTSESEIRFLYEQYRDKILSSCPLTFIIERPNFVEKKDYLRIDSVENSDFELLPPNNFILSPYNLKDPAC